MYTAKFRKLTFDKNSLIENKCFLPISLGQEYHESFKLASIIQLINKTFNNCTVIISDSLHRHTLRIQNPGLSAASAQENAYNLGKKWLLSNESILKQLEIPHELHFWDDFLNDPEYIYYRRILNELCEQDLTAKRLLENMVYGFLNIDNTQCEMQSDAFLLTKEYVLEEHAIQLCMIPKRYPKHHFIYPYTKRLEPLFEFYEHMNQGESCRWLRLRITRK